MLSRLRGHLVHSRFTKDFAVTLSGQVGVLGLGVASNVVAARLLGPQGRGELAALILWPMFLIFLFSMGNSDSIIFHTGKRRFEVSEIWTSTLVAGLVLSAGAVLVGIWAIPIALRQDSTEVQRLGLLFLAFAPVVWLTGIPASLMLGRLEVGYYSLLRLICPTIYTTGLLVLCLLDKPSLKDALAFLLLGFVVQDVYGFGLIHHKLKPRWRWNFEACRSIVTFGWKTQIGNFASYVNRRMDQLLLCLFVPPRDLGFYVVAVAVSTAVGFFPQAAQIVTMATGSNSDFDRAKNVLAKSFVATLFVLTLGCSVLYVACPWLIPFAFGASFTPAVTACRILLPGSVAMGLNQVLFSGARALDHPALPSYAEGSAVLVTCISLYALLPRYGFVGAAIASTLAYVSSLGLMLFLLRSQVNFGLREVSRGASEVFRSVRNCVLAAETVPMSEENSQA